MPYITTSQGTKFFTGPNASRTDAITNLKKRLWMPSAISGVSQASIVDESAPRHDFTGTAAAVSTTVTRFTGNMVIPAGTPVSKITFYAVGAIGTPTHQAAILVDTSGNILGLSADDTSNAWAATSYKTFTLTTTYRPTADIAVLAGLWVVAGTPPTVPVKTAQNIFGELPKISCNQSGVYNVIGDITSPVTFGANAAMMYVALS